MGQVIINPHIKQQLEDARSHLPNPEPPPPPLDPPLYDAADGVRYTPPPPPCQDTCEPAVSGNDDIDDLVALFGANVVEPDNSETFGFTPFANVGDRDEMLAREFEEQADPQQDRWLRDPVAWVRDRLRGELWSRQRLILESVRDNALTAVKTCHTVGKGLALNTPLPTPTGWTTMGDVCVGDELIDEEGNSTRIVAMSPVRELDCYEVEFVTGEMIVCDGDHLWTYLPRDIVNPIDWRDHWSECKTTSARELVATPRLHIPLTRSLHGWHDDDKLPMDPYLLGAWLGDGWSHALAIGVTATDRQIIDRCATRSGYAVRERTWEYGSRGVHHTRAAFTHPTLSGAAFLRSLNLYRNKHIPREYLRASHEARLELLRGLLDTDGCAHLNGTASIVQSNELLLWDIHELVASLGMKVNRSVVGDRLIGLQITGQECPFALERKAQRWHERPTTRPARRTAIGVRRIARCHTVPTRCIVVDSTRSLFLAGRDMIPTHNSYSAALLACWWIDCHPPGTAFVVTTAPSGAQVKAILWRYVNRLHEAGGLPGRMNQVEWYIGNEMVALGRKPSDYSPDTFQGIHAQFVLAILDEACGIEEVLWNAISTLTSNAGARTLAIGNPDDPTSYFAKVCAPGSTWNTITIGAFDTPNLTGEEVPPAIAASLIAAEWVARKKIEWGEDSPLYQSKVLGKFPVDAEDGIIPASFINPCRYLAESTLPSEPAAGGIDVGDTNDRTVIFERKGQRAGRFKIIDHGGDAMNAVGQLVQVIRDWDLATVTVDVIGVGWGVYSRLRELSRIDNPTNPETSHSAHVQRFSAGERAHDDVRFVNKRAELWWEIGRELSRQKGWDVSELDDDVIAELTAPKYRLEGSKGRILVESKEDIRKRLGRSTDLADALLMAFYAGEPPIPPAHFPSANRRAAETSLTGS